MPIRYGSAEPKAKPKYQLIAGQLRDQIGIGALRPGDTLPSYRTLIKQYGVTLSTVRQAIQTLQSEKLVEAIPNVGCLVAERGRICRKVGVASIGPANPTYLFMLETLQSEFASLHCDVAIHFVAKVTDETLEGLIEWGRRQDGILLMGWVPVGVLQALNRAGIRVVQCGEPIDGPCPMEVSGVFVSVKNLVGLAVSHLVGLGHRDITLYSQTGSRYFDLFAEIFRAHCKEYGIEGNLLRCEVGNENSCLRMLEWINGQKTPPSALLVSNERIATKAIESLNANGWPVPERISVMATALADREPGIRADLTCVLWATREVFLRAVQILLSLIESYDPHAHHEIVVGKYVPGKTCKACQ